ncbi:MAG TPA: hypothetical protein VHL11_19705, partial [Phototrophicaceae bacterium]|nr:hypothetical protein [Phototrophicaceae bacterium]
QLLDSIPRLQWWVDPLWQFQSLMGVVGIIAVTLINIYYGRDLPVPILTSTILVVWCGLSYQWKRQPGWLWTGLLLTGMSWFFVLNELDIQSVLVYTVPGAVLLLLLARYVNPQEEIILEYAGIGVLLLGCLWTTVMYGLHSPFMILSGAQMVGLMMYGYLVRRQFLFTSGGLTLIGGGGLLLIKISFWFVPLLLGLGLMVAAVGLEVARESLEGWFVKWNTRWTK